MKKIIFFIIITFSIMLTNFSSAFEVYVTKPRPCPELAFGYSVCGVSSTIQVKFHAYGGPGSSYWYIYVIQDGNTLPGPWTGYSYGDGEVTTDLPFPTGFCLNHDATLKIMMFEIDHPENTATVYGYFHTYCSNNFQCSQYRAAISGTATQQSSGNVGWVNNNGCSWSGGYDATRYRVDFTANYENFTHPNVVVDYGRCNGFSAANPNGQSMWGAIDNVSNTSATFHTFVYWAYNHATYQYQWWPCSPQEAAVAFTVVEAPPPVLAYTWQSPACIYRGEHGQLRAVLSQGDCCGLWVNWFSNNRPSYITDDASTNFTKNVNIYNNYTAEDIGDLFPVYYFNLQAGNSNGYSNWLTGQMVYSSTTYRPGGCPFISVQDQDLNFYPDNNILHRSEFSENQDIDISDLYKLNINPYIDENNNIQLKIIETNSDYDYIDKVSLFAVDHYQGTSIGVTENNQIVVYDTSAVSSSGLAFWDKAENVTKYISYNYQGDTVVDGTTGDVISASGIDGKVPPPSSDSLALILWVGKQDMGDLPSIYPVNKDYAGDAFVYTNSSPVSITKRFARREYESEVIIPYAPASSVIDSAIINWNRNFQLSYLASVPIKYSGFTVTELPLTSAWHPNYENVLDYLSSKDNQYAELDSLFALNLTFSSTTIPQPGYVRDYVFQTDGRYILQNSDRPLGKIIGKELMPIKFNLQQNYPNPFNPLTTIKYDIPKTSNVTLKIYDAVGKEVATLVNEIKQAGNYEIQFNGENYASGLYFYKITAGNFSSVKKMVLIK